MFGFYGELTVSNADNDLFVDDVQVDYVPLATEPDCATNPSPAAGATGVSTSASLSWQEGPNGFPPDGFRVYFGTVNPPTTQVADQWPPYTPRHAYLGHNLLLADHALHLYWRGNNCPVWSFTTQANPNYGNSGGYNFANSTPGGAGSPIGQPAYSWVTERTYEITAWTTGDGDDGTFSFDLASYFSSGFPYFGAMFSQLQIGSNGHLSVGTVPPASTVYGQNPFPNALAPNNVIAGAWENLDVIPETYPDAHIYYGGDASKVVITYWHAHRHNATPDPNYITFQIILHPDGKIILQYNDVESLGTTIGSPSIESDAVIGIENGDGTQGLGYRVDGVGGPMFGSPLALAIVPAGIPLGVDLSAFWTDTSSGQVQITWETVSELNNAGFTLFRGSRADGADRTWLAYLPSQSPGSTQGAAYGYQDTAVAAGETYWYWLEAVDLSGLTTLHGPVSATVAGPTAVTLRGLDAGRAADDAVTWPLAALVSGITLALTVILRRRPASTK